MASDAAVTRRVISSRAIVSCTTGVKGLFDRTIRSAAKRARASLVSTIPTLWMTERIATIDATPTAMQTKKKTRRRHDARTSRNAIRTMKVIVVEFP